MTPGRHRLAALRALPYRVGALPPRRRAALAAGVLVFVAGLVVALVAALTGGAAKPPTPPSPRAIASGTVRPTPTASSTTPTASPSARPAAFACARPRSHEVGVTPVGICIPSIRVQSSMMSLGLNADHTVQVPPLSRVRDAGWYRYSAPPGAVGPTVILGHVDSAQYGEGVFFRLGRLHHGDTVLVYRADGRVATFTITSVQQVSKTSFPSMKVYGATAHAVIRLVTCGGTFDQAHGRYLDNIIAYGSLTSVRES